MIKYPSIENVWRLKSKCYEENAWTQSAFAYLQDLPWLFTEKIDGTNIRIMQDGLGQLCFGGRTNEADWNSMPGLAAMLNTLGTALRPKLAEKFKVPVTLYGEGIGAGIQSSTYGPDYRFILFDAIVHTPTGDWWLERQNVLDLGQSLGLETAPVTFTGTLNEAIAFVREKPCSALASVIAEGLVGVPRVELKLRDGARVITKIKQEFFF